MGSGHTLRSSKESDDLLGDEFGRILQRKMAGIEQVELRFWDIPQVGLRALNGKEGIVLSPHDQGLWLLVPKELVPAVIEREIRSIIVKEIQLDGVVSRAVQEKLIHGV